MKQHVQNMLYHLLPAVFWLLAIGGSLVPVILQITNHKLQITNNYYYGYLVAAIVLIVILIIGRPKRHASSVEACFRMGIYLGVASYWLPTVVFLTIPVWAYLIYRNIFSGRSIMATILGYAVVAIWAAVFIFLGWIANPWADFFASENALGWIPLGAVLLAWLASTIARQILRAR